MGKLMGHDRLLHVEADPIQKVDGLGLLVVVTLNLLSVKLDHEGV